MHKYKVFISYRRKGGYDTAKLLYDRLRMDGYSVSFDIDTLVNGNFDTELEQRVTDCEDFLLVLSPGIFDRFLAENSEYDPENDWVRREIATALKTNKNIIPISLEGFTFPKVLPDDVKDILRKNAVDLSPKYFEASLERIKSFMQSKPNWLARHKKKIMLIAGIILLAIAGATFSYVHKMEDNMEQAKERREQARERAKIRRDSIEQHEAAKAKEIEARKEKAKIKIDSVKRYIDSLQAELEKVKK